MGKLANLGFRKVFAIAGVTALCTGPGIALAAPAASAAPYPTLEQAFDNVGITAPSAPSTGNFDGIGDSFQLPPWPAMR